MTTSVEASLHSHTRVFALVTTLFAITTFLAAPSFSSAAPADSSSISADQQPSSLSGLPHGGLSQEARAMVLKYPQALAAARFYRGIETGNINDENRSLAKNWVDVPLGDGQGPGRDGFATVLAGYHQAFPNLTVHIDEIAIAGNTVTSRNTLTGNQDGPFLGVPATGRRVTLRTTDVHHYKDGLIQNTYHLEDLFGAYQQITAGR